MSQDIAKETFVEADARTTKALTYDMLHGLHEKIDNLADIYHAHLRICNGRFEKLEKAKKRDTIVSGMFGFIGGFIASAAKWLKDIF